MILERLRNWRDRFHHLKGLLHRLEAAQETQASELRAVQSAVLQMQQLLEQIQQAQQDARREANDGIGRLHGVACNTQQLSGDTLSSVNGHQMHGLAVADLARQAIGRLETRQLSAAGKRPWHENEFRVYSQFGEDGLLQFLFREIKDAPHTFVEFGVEDYQEANTRFLLLQDRSWSGLVLDGDDANVDAIRRDVAYLRYPLKAAAAWISRENINDLLREQDMVGKIGLLSIDIDGNDYWVWETITVVDPAVVVVEYNYRFGPQVCAVVPYDARFDKATAHPSGIYYGASLAALTALARRKGYALVGCSGGGVNAFFVRRESLSEMVHEVSAEEAYAAGHHAEMRDLATGQPRKATLEEQQQLLLSLPLEWLDDTGRQRVSTSA